MHPRRLSLTTLAPALGLLAVALLAGCGGGGGSDGPSLVALSDSVTAEGLAAPVVGPADTAQRMELQLLLPPRPIPIGADANMTRQQIIDAYSPSQAEYDRVRAFATGRGLTVTDLDDARTILFVAAPVGTVQSALHVRMLRRTRPDGTEFLGPDAAPRVPAAMAALHMGLVGIDAYNAEVYAAGVPSARAAAPPH